MKKALYTSTVLAAAGVLAFSATDSQAKAKKMSMSLSGSMTSMMGWSKQDSAFESTASSTARVHYDAFNLVNDSEIHFKGKTKLDNGVAIDVVLQLETDQSIHLERLNGGRTIDESYVRLSGGFGDIRIGTTKATNFTMSGGAPGAGAVGVGGAAEDWFIIRPSAMAGALNFPGTNDGAGDDMRIVYYTPKFNGFQVGATYTPSSADQNMPAAVGGNDGTEQQKYDLTAAYNGKMGATTLKLGAGYVINQGAAANSTKTWNLSGRVGFGGWEVGAAYRERDDTDTTSAGAVQNANASTIWQTGISYASGPFKLGLSYMGADTPQTAAVPGDDSMSSISMGGQYNISPGVDLKGSIIRVSWEDELTNDANNNDGWAVVGGISVGF